VPGIQSFSSPPSITCLVFNESFHDQVQYVYGIESYSSPPSPLRVWYSISLFTTKSNTYLVFNHSLHHQALRAWYSIILFTTKHYVPGIQSFSSPPSITCLIFNHSLHHQDRYVSGMESVFSPPIPVSVWYSFLSGGLIISPGYLEVYHGHLYEWCIGKVKVHPRKGHEGPEGE